jgi:hypothetical protein
MKTMPKIPVTKAAGWLYPLKIELGDSFVDVLRINKV